MPKLSTYSANIQNGPVSGGRSATAADFGGETGAGLSALGTSAEKASHDVLTAVSETEARQAIVGASTVRAKYAQELDAAATSGANTDEIKARMNADLAKVGENFATSKGQYELDVHTQSTNQLFDSQADAIAVHRAGVDAQVEGAKFLRSESSIIATNPQYLEYASQNADAFAATLTRIPVEKRKQIADGLKLELNTSAAMASARIDPKETIKRLEAGDWDLTPEGRQQAISQANTTIRAQRADEDHARALKEYNEREINDTARDEHFKTIIDGTATQGAIMDDGRLQPGTREHLITFMEARNRELATREKASNPETMRDLWLSINAPEGDPRKVYTADTIFRAVERGEINTRDANNLNGLVAAQKDENGRNIGSNLNSLMNTIGRALSQDPQFTAQPALVAQIQMDYQARVYAKVTQLRNVGEDPNDVFNPASKNYVGSKEFIQGSINNSRGSGLARLDAMQIGQEVTKDGEAWTYKGGDPKLPASWEKKVGNPALAPRDPGRSASGTIGGLAPQPTEQDRPVPAPQSVTPPAPTAPDDKKSSYIDWRNASKAYSDSIDDFQAIGRQKNPDPEKYHDARERMLNLKQANERAYETYKQRNGVK